MPKKLVVELIKLSVFRLNTCLAKGRVSSTLSPRTLLTSMTIDSMPIAAHLLVPTLKPMRRITVQIANNPEPLEPSP